MKNLDVEILKKFLKIAGDHLLGEWLLVGGTLLPAVGITIRVTVDIDLIGLGEKERGQLIELMKISESLGISVESINQAAGFFLDKVGYKKDDLLVLHKGRHSIIYRPSVMLYWKLKLERLTESDFIDCQYYYHFCVTQKDIINQKTMHKMTKAYLKQEVSEGNLEKQKRLKFLNKIINEIK